MRRTWPLRLAQFSPLIVVLLIVAVWLSLPATMRANGLQRGVFPNATDDIFDFPPEYDPTVEALTALTYDIQLKEEAGGESPMPTSGLQEAADMVTSAVSMEASRLAGSDGILAAGALKDSDAAAFRLLEHERTTGGAVAVYALPPRDKPPVALSSVADTSVLTAQELAEFEAANTMESLRREVRHGGTRPLRVDFESLNGGTGSVYGDRLITYGSRAIGGHIYEIYVVEPTDGAGNMLDTLGWSDLESHRVELDRETKRTRGAVFVIGPVDAEWVELRRPTGVDEATMARMAEAAGENLDDMIDPTQAFRFAAEPGTASGMPEWGAFAIGVPNLQQPAALPLVFLGAYEENPSIPYMWSVVGDTPMHRLQVWLTLQLPFVLGALFTVLLVALVASPVAFVLERRWAQERDLEAERTRVQREARERVVDRLTQLSQAMDRASQQVSGEASREAERVAGDIDQTVSELKRILGELPMNGGDGDE